MFSVDSLTGLHVSPSHVALGFNVFDDLCEGDSHQFIKKATGFFVDFNPFDDKISQGDAVAFQNLGGCGLQNDTQILHPPANLNQWNASGGCKIDYVAFDDRAELWQDLLPQLIRVKVFQSLHLHKSLHIRNAERDGSIGGNWHGQIWETMIKSVKIWHPPF